MKTTNTSRALRLLSAAVVGAAIPVHAALVTALPPDIDARVIHFNGYDSFDSARVLAPVTDVGTAEVGERVDLAFTNDSVTHVLGPVAASFGRNGSWPADGGYAGLGQISGSMSFTFTRNLNFVGAYVNYDPALDGTTSITAYDEFDNVLESTVLTFDFADAGGTGLGRYLGFERSAADIRSIVFSNARIAVDDLGFGTTRDATGMPAPATLLLAGLGLALLCRPALTARFRPAARAAARP
jgi:hypothetical protein